MDKFSTRYMEWFDTSLNSASSQPVTTEPAPRPKYMVWVAGGRATYGKDSRDATLNGEMLGMADLNFAGKLLVEETDEPSSFNIAVETPEEGIALIRRISCYIGIGIIELEDDNQYHEWYSDDAESASEIAEAQDAAYFGYD